MGTAELEVETGQLILRSHIITYGNAATPGLTEQIRDEIETMWNEPSVVIPLHGENWQLLFRITAFHHPQLEAEEIFGNINPVNNYFRIEEFALGNISFVDGLGCNTGYFKLENLYEGSTTAAHEYGHTLGLKHPTDIDLRGQGVPGIMYPRGTLVDAPYQYNPGAIAGDSSNGGTMHPRFRKVKVQDIHLLQLHRLDVGKRPAIIGEFSSIWHEDQSTASGAGFAD